MEKKHVNVSYTSIVTLRILVSLIFIVASINHLFQTEKAVARMGKANLGELGTLLGTPEVAVIVSGVIMLIFGLLLAIGIKTRLSAMILIVVLIPITITVQLGQMETIGPLFKNIAIMGGLLFFILNKNMKPTIKQVK